MKVNKSKLNKKKYNGKGLYDKAINYYLTGSKLNPGEKHVIMYDYKLKKYVPASYSGPGTDILKNIKENKQPINKVDKTAQTHDIRYTLAKDINDIKIADKKMVDKLEQLQKNKEESTFNILPSKYGIKANQIIEKILPDKYYDKFINYITDYKDYGKKLKEEDKKILENKLNELEIEGYGKKKNKKKLNNKKK